MTARVQRIDQIRALPASGLSTRLIHDALPFLIGRSPRSARTSWPSCTARPRRCRPTSTSCRRGGRGMTIGYVMTDVPGSGRAREYVTAIYRAVTAGNVAPQK